MKNSVSTVFKLSSSLAKLRGEMRGREEERTGL